MNTELERVKLRVSEKCSQEVASLLTMAKCNHAWKEHGLGYKCSNCGFYTGTSRVTDMIRRSTEKLDTKKNRDLFTECGHKVQDEYQMGGLSGGLYEDFAWDTMLKFMEALNKADK